MESMVVMEGRRPVFTLAHFLAPASHYFRIANHFLVLSAVAAVCAVRKLGKPGVSAVVGGDIIRL